MTPQEEQLLHSLTDRINNTQLQEKDPDAEALLNQELSQNPDAIYILAQTVLVQNIALEQAKAQVAQMQAQMQQQPHPQPARATSFLGSLLGHHDPPPQAYVPPPPPPPAYVQQAYAQPQYIPVGQPSFLRGAMQTAAGVAAGALAFEGVEAVLHGLGGFGGGYGWGGPGIGMGMGPGMMGGGFERPVEETVINNYYDQPGAGQEHLQQGGFDLGGLDRDRDVPHFHESAGQSGAQLTDAGYTATGDDQGTYDTDSTATGQDAGFDSGPVDDGNSFDNTGFDDGGSGFDNGGGFGGDSGGGDLL